MARKFFGLGENWSNSGSCQTRPREKGLTKLGRHLTGRAGSGRIRKCLEGHVWNSYVWTVRFCFHGPKSSPISWRPRSDLRRFPARQVLSQLPSQAVYVIATGIGTWSGEKGRTDVGPALAPMDDKRRAKSIACQISSTSRRSRQVTADSVAIFVLTFLSLWQVGGHCLWLDSSHI